MQQEFDLRKAIQLKFGSDRGFLARAAQSLGINYTYLSNMMTGKQAPSQKVLKGLGLLPDMPHLPHGSTCEYVVVIADAETAALIRYLEAWPDGRFTNKKDAYLNSCLKNGLIVLKDYLAKYPVANADAIRLQREATAQVPEGNPDIDDAIDPLA